MFLRALHTLRSRGTQLDVCALAFSNLDTSTRAIIIYTHLRALGGPLCLSKGLFMSSKITSDVPAYLLVILGTPCGAANTDH